MSPKKWWWCVRASIYIDSSVGILVVFWWVALSGSILDGQTSLSPECSVRSPRLLKLCCSVIPFLYPPRAGIGKLPALAGRYFGISFRYYIGKIYRHWPVGISVYHFGINVHVIFAYLMVFTRFHITLTLGTVISTPLNPPQIQHQFSIHCCHHLHLQM